MSQPKLKKLASLLEDYQSEFLPDADRPYGIPDDSQPMYVEILSLIRRQVVREIE